MTDKKNPVATARNKKFVCPECGQNAWAKADTLLVCGVCAR
jgi:predicted RNA-binding Zn-ribbon protein involved in translation (DUF1610 family)